MGIDTMTVELKTRQVSSDFINNFQEKLVYVGDSNEYSEEFEQISKKNRKWRHMDMTGMRMTRWSLTVMSRMIYLHTLILDNCHLDVKSLGFLGYVPSVTTLSLNKNNFKEYRNVVNIISLCFPIITYLSFLGNPFYRQFANDNDVAQYRNIVAVKNKYLRFLDGAALSDKEQNTETAREAMDDEPDIARETQEDEDVSGSNNNSDAAISQNTSYKKQNYHYKGSRSEGNRYIKNVQL